MWRAVHALVLYGLHVANYVLFYIQIVFRRSKSPKEKIIITASALGYISPEYTS